MRSGLLGAITVLLWLAVAQAAVARWSIQPTPAPSRFAHLEGVSCVSGSRCTAVGYFGSADDPQPLVERSNGSRWSWTQAAKPAGVSAAALRGVSCASRNSCIAVGYLNSASNQRPLVERWNGTRWSIQPNPASRAKGTLDGVSCLSSRVFCIAVGYRFASGRQRALVERWNGTRWSIQPNPGFWGDSLLGVSCVSSVSCWAVGTSPPGGIFGPPRPFAERWDGSQWSDEAIAAPGYGALAAVSCSSSTRCTMVGTDFDGQPSPLAERWDGVRWVIQATAEPSGRLPRLLGVSCTSATECTAVGDYETGGFTLRTVRDRTLAERWRP